MNTQLNTVNTVAANKFLGPQRKESTSKSHAWITYLLNIFQVVPMLSPGFFPVSPLSAQEESSQGTHTSAGGWMQGSRSRDCESPAVSVYNWDISVVTMGCANLPDSKAKCQSGTITDICLFLRWHLLRLCTNCGVIRYLALLVSENSAEIYTAGIQWGLLTLSFL